MNDEPNSLNERPRHEATEPDATFSSELEPLAQRLRADAALWQSRLPDPSGAAERIQAIPLTTPRDRDERRYRMSTQIGVPPEHGQRPQRPVGRPAHLGPRRGLLAAFAAVLIVGVFSVVLVQFVQQSGKSTGPIGQPTLTQPLPTQTQPAAPTATATATPTGTWTTIQGFTASGNYQTASFQVTSPWRLVWQCNRSMGNPGPYPLQVDVLPSSGSGGALGVIDAVCQAGNTSGTSAEHTTPTGLVYLRVRSAADGEWDLRVQVLR